MASEAINETTFFPKFLLATIKRSSSLTNYNARVSKYLFFSFFNDIRHIDIGRDNHVYDMKRPSTDFYCRQINTPAENGNRLSLISDVILKYPSTLQNFHASIRHLYFTPCMNDFHGDICFTNAWGRQRCFSDFAYACIKSAFSGFA